MTETLPVHVTATLAAYAANAASVELPADVLARARFHVLDTLASMLSGSQLAAGQAALAYAASLSEGACLVPGTALRLRPVDAALVNGMSAHADETDDTHAASLTHPGSVIVPAAWAVGEHVGASGMQVLRAAALGYDVCCRIGITLGSYDFFRRGFDPHAFGGVFGAAFAAGSLLGFDAARFRTLASYAAQQASGITTWVRDTHHVEKAFDFAGMPARNGVEAALLVASGMSGVADVFDGTPNFLQVFNPQATPAALIEGLGARYEIARTTIKKWCVATPAQASLDGLQLLLTGHGLAPSDIATVTATIPAMSARVVTGREMPNVNVEHLVALLLVDDRLGFANTHDAARITDPAVLAARRRVTIVPSDTMPADSRGAHVAVETIDGRAFACQIDHVRGTPANQMDTAEIAAKASDLITPLLGAARASGWIERLLTLDTVSDIRSLAPLFSLQ